MAFTQRGTDYAETEALLAAIADDADTLDKQLGNLLPSERRTLMAACYTIIRTIDRMPGHGPDRGTGDHEVER